MKPQFGKIFIWLPRLSGLAFTLFLVLVASHVFSEGYRGQNLTNAFILQLIPAAIVLIFTIIGWRQSGWGAGLFAIIGAVYIIMSDSLPWLTYVFVAGPMFLIALMFLADKILVYRPKGKNMKNENTILLK